MSVSQLSRLFPDPDALTQRMLETTVRLSDINSGSWNRDGIASVHHIRP